MRFDRVVQPFSDLAAIIRIAGVPQLKRVGNQLRLLDGAEFSHFAFKLLETHEANCKPNEASCKPLPGPLGRQCRYISPARASPAVTRIVRRPVLTAGCADHKRNGRRREPKSECKSWRFL